MTDIKIKSESESISLLFNRFSKLTLRVIAKKLEEIIKGNVILVNVGLCGAIDQHSTLKCGVSIIEICSQSWSEFSGSLMYPIPHPELEPGKAYDIAQYKGMLYDRRTAYGKARYRLAEHCLKLVIKAQESMGVQ